MKENVNKSKCEGCGNHDALDEVWFYVGLPWLEESSMWLCWSCAENGDVIEEQRKELWKQLIFGMELVKWLG